MTERVGSLWLRLRMYLPLQNVEFGNIMNIEEINKVLQGIYLDRKCNARSVSLPPEAYRTVREHVGRKLGDPRETAFMGMILTEGEADIKEFITTDWKMQFIKANQPTLPNPTGESIERDDSGTY